MFSQTSISRVSGFSHTLNTMTDGTNGHTAPQQELPLLPSANNDVEDSSQPQPTTIAPATNQQTAPISNGSAHNEAASAAPDAQGITADEIALYDRQIRLWGMQAQERIRTAHVLLIGLRGLGGEVAKNLVLAGIGSLTVADDQVFTEEDLGAQFLVTQADVGKNRAEAVKSELHNMNPRVKIQTNSSSVSQLVHNPQFFQQFTIVIATDLPVDVLQILNSVCRLCAKPFYAAATYGFHGYIFADLIQHSFVLEREKSNMTTRIGPESATRSIVSTATKKSDNGKTIELVTKTELYSPLSQVLHALLPTDRIQTRRKKLQISPILACIKALWNFQINTAKAYPNENSPQDLAAFTQLATEWHKNYLLLPPETLKAEVLRQFLQGVSTELPPTCGFLGGALAQNVINVIGQNEQPIQNLLIWDGEEITAEIYAMHPLTPDMVPAAMIGQMEVGQMSVGQVGAEQTQVGAGVSTAMMDAPVNGHGNGTGDTNGGE